MLLLLLLPPDADFPGTGELENLRNRPDGDNGAPSVVLMLTLTGRDSGSCLNGIFSGGPIGLSSLFRFFFFSILDRSSDRFPTLAVDFSPVPPFAELIGVIVMDDLIFGGGVDEIGIISIPSLRSSPVNTELNPPADVIGVMLTAGATFSSPSDRESLAAFFSFRLSVSIRSRISDVSSSRQAFCESDVAFSMLMGSLPLSVAKLAFELGVATPASDIADVVPKELESLLSLD